MSAEEKELHVDLTFGNKRWVNFPRVALLVMRAMTRRWQWPYNPDCKYLTIRIDMRDGGCALRDRNGKPITIEDAERQNRAPESAACREQAEINKIKEYEMLDRIDGLLENLENSTGGDCNVKGLRDIIYAQMKSLCPEKHGQTATQEDH